MAEELAFALRRALDLVLKAHGNAWEPGDNLALVRCDDKLFELIGVAVRKGIGGERLSSQDHVRWGALALMGGAQALRRADDRPRTYATIGEILKVPGFADAMRNWRLDVVETGAEQYLGVSIIRGRSGRRFLETMIANSGIDLGLVLAGAARVAASWSWGVLANAELEDVTAFVHAHRAGFDLRPGLRALVETEQGAFALADRLRELARFRRLVLERGLFEPSVEGTRALWAANGLDPATFLGGPAPDALIRTLFNVGRAAEAEHAEPRFTWIATERYRGLALALPRYLRAGDIPVEVDEVRVVLVGREGAAASDAIRYIREGGAFRAARLTTVPIYTAQSAPPVQLFAQWDDAEGCREVRYGSYDLPGVPVTVFGPSGESILRPGPGTTVQLVVSAGWNLDSAASELVRAGEGAVESWRTVIPNEPLPLEFVGPYGERATWVLGADPQARLTPRRGKRISGLRVGNAPVFTAWPELEAEGIEGRVALSIQQPGGSAEETSAIARNGRIRLSPRRAPGAYTVEAIRGARRARTRFVLLPDAHPVMEHLPPESGGARATRVTVRGAAVHLTPKDTDARAFGEWVEFPAGTPGQREVGVALPALGLVGTWTVGIHPPSVRLLVDGERELPQPWSMRECTAASAIELTGEPAASVDLETLGKRLEIVLGAEGRRRIRLCELPRGLLDNERGQITFRWAGGRIDVEYRNASLERPVFHVEGRTARIAPLHPLDGNVVAEILPVWEPWREFAQVPVRHVSDGAGLRYEVELPGAPGRYFVGLSQRDRAATGLCLAEVPGESPAFASPLSRLLWERDTKQEVLRAALAHEPCDVLERVAQRVNRYGQRYFNAAGALRDVAGRGLAEVLAQGRSVEQSPLYRFLAQYDLDLLVLRYSDLARIVPANSDEASATDLLDELSGRALGLVVAAVRIWPAAFSAERFREIIKPWAAISHGDPVTLTPEDLDVVRTPDSPDVLRHREKMSDSPRLQGLIQARKAEKALDDDPALREVTLRYLAAGTPGPGYWRVAGTDPQRLPQATARLDAVAHACATAVHAWRLGRGNLTACRDARRLGRRARALIDYWLNLLVAQTEGVLA